MFGEYEVVNLIETNVYTQDYDELVNVVRADENIVKTGSLEECINYLKIQMIDFILKMENQDICTLIDNYIYKKCHSRLSLGCDDFDYEVCHYSEYIIRKSC